MPSPFPGMNPYLEQPGVWNTVHTHALTLFVERLVPQVVLASIVTMGEHVSIHEFADGANDIERVVFIEIRDRRKRELITVLELLSPANKCPGADRDLYLSKRRQILASTTHFVEIDLLRGGVPTPADDRPACDYAVMVSRAEERPRAGFWPIGLRERLPVIPVPLRPPDADARLDLQEVLDHVHDAGGYSYYIYEGEPEPPLRPEDAAWARALVPLNRS